MTRGSKDPFSKGPVSSGAVSKTPGAKVTTLQGPVSRRSGPQDRSPRTTVHCAIYTRKSSEEGLDQDFNSLDAQYEAASAYIQSQRHEGWRLLDARYDDGGHSGGTLERPALERLLTDIDQGHVDMVVVYKIDRLTRSLADFARLVERMDKAGCSFVSVTQSFNTSTSMGRLTLNVLLSFAQFEREVTAERIRDKIAASKARGLWMGGYPPLGYDRHPDDKVRSLVINAREAEDVRTLFALYEADPNLASTQIEAGRRNIRSKSHRLSDGRIRGGNLMSRGQIQALLANPVYAGLIRHKDRTHPGQHAAIIEPDRWHKVQEILQAHGRKPRGRKMSDRSRQPDRDRPLRGLLVDEHGRSLSTTHTIKDGKRYDYYVTRETKGDRAGDGSPAWRLPARRIEASVQNAIIAHLDRLRASQVWLNDPTVEDMAPVAARAEVLLDAARSGLSHLAGLIDEVRLGPDALTISLNSADLGSRLDVDPERLAESLCSFTVPITLKRRGIETRLVISDKPDHQPDRTLIATLCAAHRWLDLLKSGKTLTEIARIEQRSETYIRSRIAIALLAPSLQGAILEGRQPADLTADHLARRTLPDDWSRQAETLRFAAN